MQFVIILFSLFVLGLNYKRNKIVFTLLLACGILIMGLNYENPDYINYEGGFERADSISEFSIFNMLDVGNRIILASFKEFGIKQYQDYRLIYTAILFIIFGFTILRNCKYPNVMLIIYLAFYLVLDEIQMRNFSSFVVFLPFLLYFLQHQNSKGIIIYVLGVVIAFTLHFSAIFYLIFAFSIFKSKWTQFVFCLCCGVILSLADSSFSNMAMVEHVKHYGAPSIAGALVGCSALILNYLFVSYSYKESRYIDIHLKGSVAFIKSFDVVTRFNFLLMALMPIIFINSTVLRIWRFTSIFNIILLLGLIYYLHCSKRSNKLMLLTFLYAATVSLWMNYEGVWPSLFNNPILD